MSESSEKFNVLIAMDGSEHAKFAFDWYKKQIHKHDFHVVMVHVMDLKDALHEAEWYKPNAPNCDVKVLQKIIEDEKEKIRKELAVYAQMLKDAELEGTVKSIHSDQPGKGIIQAAEECNARMIITGCRGMGKVRRTFMGSVSDYIVHHASVPTLVCRHPREHHHK